VITPELLEAYVACPLKCYLHLIGEKSSENNYATWFRKKDDSYRLVGIKRLASAYSHTLTEGQIDWRKLKKVEWELALNQTLEADGLSAAFDALQRTSALAGTSEISPIRFVSSNRPSRADRMRAAFDALVLSKVLRQAVPTATIIYGDRWATLKIKVALSLRELTRAIDKAKTLLATAVSPDLVLNRHCPECEYRDRCRAKAMEKDDLSLLAGLTDKERSLLNRKGIFTVNQLSHTFRPRRRSKRLIGRPEKYHHSLRALAVRENKIHVVGQFQLPAHGTPIFFDVESLPDCDFYYLIGVHIETDGRSETHSFWANSLSDERTIWGDFLELLSTVEKPILIHYGSFETKFLKKMLARYGSPPKGSSAAEAIASPFNLLSAIFARVYFPSYSNGLKENARFLGFQWSDRTADGLQAIVWRRQWEEAHDPEVRAKLITYNEEDCAALAVMTQVLHQLCEGAPASNTSSLRIEAIHADTIGPHESKWRPFKSPILDLERINSAARWDYQRDRVFVRGGRARRQIAHKSGRHTPKKAQKIVFLHAPKACPRCQKIWRRKGRLLSRTVRDLIFGRYSVKQRVIQYVAQTYICRSCGHEWGLSDLRLHGRDWGWNIVAYFVYNVIALRIPQLTVQHSINRLFGGHVVRSSLNEFKARASRIYSDTRADILNRIVRGNVIHADETSANIKGQLGYVWVLTNHTDVVYILTESREAETIRQLLHGFRGVLVSDFYAAYESIECPQQKCLIHLMRDLNDDILNNPFDEEAKSVALQFASLLRSIVDTIDRRGLKTYFLRKHLKHVDRFFSFLHKSSFRSEVANKLKQRFEKNEEKLFTFLHYDGVPWNNNNAEHAIKSFARLRDIIAGSSTKKGIEEYLSLLSVSESCKYRGIDFLDFLRSGERDVASFSGSSRKAKLHSRT
jgi:predicted RecB family nuclease